MLLWVPLKYSRELREGSKTLPEKGVNGSGVRSEDKNGGVGERQQEKGLNRVHMSSVLST